MVVLWKNSVVVPVQMFSAIAPKINLKRPTPLSHAMYYFLRNPGIKSNKSSFFQCFNHKQSGIVRNSTFISIQSADKVKFLYSV